MSDRSLHAPSPQNEDRLPCGAVTGVGSLPLRDPGQAIRLVQRASPEIPFWPQLPGRSSAETSLLQFLGAAEPYVESDDPARLVVRSGMATRLLDALDSADGALDTERAAGFVPFLEALRGGDFPRAWMVKAQITGPVSLGVCISDFGGPILRDVSSAA